MAGSLNQDFQNGWCLLARAWSYECLREITRVHERWVDCLNQDLLDLLDLQDAACLVVRMWLDERLQEMYECLRVLGRLSESGFAGFIGFSGCGLSRGTDVVGRVFAKDVGAFTRDGRAFTRVCGLSGLQFL